MKELESLITNRFVAPFTGLHPQVQNASLICFPVTPHSATYKEPAWEGEMPYHSIQILQLSAFGSPILDCQMCHLSPTDLGVTASVAPK